MGGTTVGIRSRRLMHSCPPSHHSTLPTKRRSDQFLPFPKMLRIVCFLGPALEEESRRSGRGRFCTKNWENWREGEGQVRPSVGEKRGRGETGDTNTSPGHSHTYKIIIQTKRTALAGDYGTIFHILVSALSTHYEHTR